MKPPRITTYLTVAKAAELLGITPRQADLLADLRELEATTHEGRSYISTRSVIARKDGRQ